MTTTLILGASRGIGLELVRQSCAAGERVIASARNDAGLAVLKDLGAEPLKVDVTDAASLDALGSQLAGERLDIAWYVAGVMSRGGATQPPAGDEFDHVMRTNVRGAMQAIPVVTPLVEAAKGKFVFISSAMGHIAEVPSSYSWVYRASKAALNMAVAAAQHDYPNAILVAMSPGWVQTDMGGVGAPLTAQQSVAAMRAAAAGLGAAQRGSFLNELGERFAGW